MDIFVIEVLTETSKAMLISTDEGEIWIKKTDIVSFDDVSQILTTTENFAQRYGKA